MRKLFNQWMFRTVLALVCLLSGFTQANAAWYLVGDIGGNGWTFNPQTTMTNNGNGTWSWTGVISSGTKYFAFANNTANDWGTFNSTYRFSSNGAVTLGVRAYATVQGDHTSTFSGDGSNYTITFTESDKGFIIEKVPDTYTVAGTPTSLFGTEWDASNNANNMTETSNGIFTWSKENVELTAGTSKFKVVKNHNWDTAYPGSDYEISIPSNGTYNVTITFNSSTKDVNATIEAVATTPDVYYVRGNSTDFFGNDSWNTNANVMTTTDDTNYTWTSGQATLAAGAAVQFKVVKNGSQWIGTEGDNNGENIVCTATQAGVYTLTVNYTVHGVPTGTLNLVAGAPDAPTFTPAAGTYNSNQSVTLACATSGATIYYTTDGNDPTTTSTVYSGAIDLNSEATTTIKAIAVVDGRSSTVAEATYTIAYDRYYVVGEPNDVFPSGWTIGDAQLMTANGTTWTWIKSPITLAEDATIAFKVKKKSGNDETWIPSGANITVSPEYGAGNYALTITYVEGQATPTGTLTPLFVTTPVFSPAPGTYDTNQNVTITAGNGTIYYTTDGTDPETSETRIAYNGPISVAGEGEHIIKAVSVYNGSTSDVATAVYVINYQNIYLFGSVGKQHTWLYSYTNPELTTSDGINYYGVYDILNMPSYTDRQGAGLFLLTTGFGTNWETTQQYMIGSTGSGNFWIDGSHNYLGEWVDAAPVGQSDKGWTIIPDNGHGTYEFFYNRSENKFKLAAFDGPTIYVYDYTRPYIYVEDKDGNPFDGVQPGNPIQTLDETVGGHSGLSTAGNGTGDGVGTLGWYKFAVPVHPANCPVKFQFHHNGDKKVIDSGIYTTSGDAYYYWDGEQYVKLNSRADADKLRRIVAHVRVQGTEVPTCDGVPMNGPSSFYGQMYYWMAVTTYDKGENVVISDGTHHYEGTLYSDIYLEWTDENASNYELISEETLEHRLANKTGRGTIIHLQKNRNTPPTKDNYVIGVDTKVQDADVWTNTTNLGTTWWGTSLDSPWKGTEAWTDGILANYDNSRFLYLENGITRGPDVYIVTAEDGTEWYTWYCDRSAATIRFGYGEALNGYPTYVNDKDVYKFFAHYESAELHQNAGELWYVWTPDFDATLDNNNQSRDNGDILDVTRTYESSAKQKALCSTFRDGNYVYYTDIKGWGDDNVYCYVWSVPGLDWPGVQMVKVGYDDEGHPVYLADLSNYDVSNAEGILFNNGVTDSHATNKRQTGNLEWQNHGCYDYLGLLYRIGGNVDVIENEPDGFPTSVTLTGVWYSRVKGTLLAKGNNDYNNKSVNGMGYKDFAKSVTDGSEDGSVLQSRDYDQSNWVEIYPSEDGLVDAQVLIDLIGKPFTLYGTKTSSVNPTFTAISISNVGAVGDKYQPNHFTPIHMNGSCYQYRRGEKEWYFFVEPKPNEFAVIDWAAYHEDNSGEYFYTPSNTGFDGEFVVDWNYFDKFNQDGAATTALEPYQMEVCGQYPGEDYLHEGVNYKGWFAIVKVNQSSAPAGDDASQTKSSDAKSVAKYTVCPVYISDDQIMTAIEDIYVDKPSGVRTLKVTRYYNMMGVESRTPFQGVNIVVKEYTDGSRESTKVIMR